MKKSRPTAMERLKARVVAVVAAVPAGRVTTYGLIAKRLRATPRQVAYILARFSPEESATLPWFRVVAAGGAVSTMKLGATGRRQVALLREEGVAVTPRNTVADFDSVVWKPV